MKRESEKVVLLRKVEEELDKLFIEFKEEIDKEDEMDYDRVMQISNEIIERQTLIINTLGV